MPPLARPENKTFVEIPARRALAAGGTDVLIVGGGPAGLGAAVGAAQAGASVILAERYGFLGGNATAALVMPLMSWHTQRPTTEEGGASTFFPRDHGPGDPVIAGALRAFLERLIDAGGAIKPSMETGFTVPFDPEIFKLTALEMLDGHGVSFLFHAFASGASEREGSCLVVFETKSGPVAVEAAAVVDCTGDGDVAAFAGAEFELGREEDGLVQPMSLLFRMNQFEPDEFQHYVATHPDEWRGVHGLRQLIKEATQSGELSLRREDILFFGTPHEHEVSVNCTRVARVLGTDVWDLSFAEWESRRQLKEIAAFLKKYVPGFARSFIVQSGVQVGVRETRRITGDYYITADDLLSVRGFHDVIARGTYPLDIHSPEGKGTVLKRIPPGTSYQIPLRALLPKGLQRILVAGRCISGSHEAHSGYRVMPISMATGQAAGVCAALAAKGGFTVHQIPSADVQKELRRQGAFL